MMKEEDNAAVYGLDLTRLCEESSSSFHLFGFISFNFKFVLYFLPIFGNVIRFPLFVDLYISKLLSVDH